MRAWNVQRWLTNKQKMNLQKVIFLEGLFSIKDVRHPGSMYQRPYERLIVWQEAHALFLWINNVANTLPQHEKFALVDQMRRSAYSVPMNIAEGNGRRTKKDKRRFFNIAHSSLEELHSQVRTVRDLGYISQEIFEKGCNWINRVSYLVMRLHQNCN